MTQALKGLLNAATFKFSTSIAGLGTSLVLSLLFRIYQILIESAFESFGRALEDRLQFQPPQRLAVESLKMLAEQRDELREINSEAFFARLGDSVAPRLQTAFADAINPISSSLDRTVEELKLTSRGRARHCRRGDRMKRWDFIAGLNCKTSEAYGAIRPL